MSLVTESRTQSMPPTKEGQFVKHQRIVKILCFQHDSLFYGAVMRRSRHGQMVMMMITLMELVSAVTFVETKDRINPVSPPSCFLLLQITCVWILCAKRSSWSDVNVRGLHYIYFYMREWVRTKAEWIFIFMLKLQFQSVQSAKVQHCQPYYGLISKHCQAWLTWGL